VRVFAVWVVPSGEGCCIYVSFHQSGVQVQPARTKFSDARMNDGVVHFDLSSTDPQRIMVKPGKAPQYGDTFFELIRLIAPALPILGPMILAAIDPASIDHLLNFEITV
jgi:hypothetical protein